MPIVFFSLTVAVNYIRIEKRIIDFFFFLQYKSLLICSTKVNSQIKSIHYLEINSWRLIWKSTTYYFNVKNYRVHRRKMILRFHRRFRIKAHSTWFALILLDKARMNLWSHRFSKLATKKFEGFLPWKNIWSLIRH